MPILSFFNYLNNRTMRLPRQQSITLFVLFLAAVSLLFTGCATGPAFTPTANVQGDQALIYVYRPGSVLGAAGEPIIYINGKYLTQMRNSAYAPSTVSPGQVIFSSMSRLSWALPVYAVITMLEARQQERLRLDAGAGKTYYVRCAPSGKLVLVDEAKGAKEIQGLKLSNMEVPK